MTLMRSQQCKARSVRSGRRCQRRAVLGAVVCRHHGGAAPQVKAAAARRLTLAEAIETSQRRHPQEVLADALHNVDVTAAELLRSIREGRLDLTAEMATAVVDANRARAGMAKLVVDSGGERWSANEAYRQQADALARIVRAMVRILGLDPADPRVVAAFEAAVAEVLHGARASRAPARIDAGPRSRPGRPSGQDTVDGEVVA